MVPCALALTRRLNTAHSSGYSKENYKRYVQFRLEAHNFLNQTQWSGVNTTATFASLTSNTITNLPNGTTQRFGFGAANSVNGARVMQLSLKVYF